MNSHAQVRTEDLGQVLDYLEGLQEILQHFDAQDVGRATPSPLVAALEGIDGYSDGWDPLRYQVSEGQGWEFVTRTVEELRERLLDAYRPAAL